MKREVNNSLLALGFVFILFLVFTILKPDLKITGMSTAQETGVEEVKILKVDRTRSGAISSTSEGNFSLDDELGCVIFYSGNGMLNVSFLAEGDDISQPRKKYVDVINNSDNRSTLCTEDNQGKLCAGFYEPEKQVLGKWRCFVSFNGVNNLSSNYMEMIETLVRVEENNTPVNITPACNPLWDCQWSECKDGLQTCAYFDRNSCGDASTKPADLSNKCSVSVGEQVVQQKPATAKVEVKSKRKSFFIPLIVASIAAVGSLAFLIFVLYKKNKEEIKKPDSVSSAQPQATQAVGSNASQQTSQPADQLQVYVESSLQQGMSREQIIVNLEKAGWNKQDVEKSVNYVIIRKFVKDKLKQGFQKDKITESLKSKGWKDEVIEKIFKELNI